MFLTLYNTCISKTVKSLFFFCFFKNSTFTCGCSEIVYHWPFQHFVLNLGCQDADPCGLSVCRVLDAITYLPGSLTDISQHQQVRHFLRQLSTEYIVNYIKLFLNKFWARIHQFTLRHKI